MDMWRSKTKKYKVVNWLLAAAILLIALLPAHYHLHHLSSIGVPTHAHAVDLHVITDASEQSHHGEETTIINSTPDTLLKDSSFVPPLIALLAVCLVLLLVSNLRTSVKLDLENIALKQVFNYFAPPLRAPPQY